MAKIFVGILIMTKLKTSENSPEETVALLQRRGKINTDNNYGFKDQSFFGLCEITSYGKAERNETPEEALQREMTEELGPKATETILNSPISKLYEKTEDNGGRVFIWTALCDKNILKEIKLDISTGGIEILKRTDLDKAKFSTFKEKGLTIKDTDEIDIFEAPKEAIEKAFEMFS